jgi:hypothetical protein
MPILPENKHRYPPDWPAISAAIRAAAGNKCQRCSAPNGVWINRGVVRDEGPGIRVWRLASASCHENGFAADTGAEVPNSDWDTCDYNPAVRVVLTVAHLDHQPEHCDPANLRAWCQRCHNAYDAPMRAKNRAKKARAKLAVDDLFWIS